MQTKIIREEDGSGLVLVLMVSLVVFALGSALGVLTVGSHHLADINRDSTSAYYIAEAGANMAYEEVENYIVEAYNKSDSDVSFYDKVSKPFGIDNNQNNIKYKNFKMQSTKQPESLVTISEDKSEMNGEDKTFVIKSTGKIGERNRTVEKKFKVKWTESQPEKTLDLNLDSVLTFYELPEIINAATVVGDITYPETLILPNKFNHNSGEKNAIPDTDMNWAEKGKNLVNWLTPLVVNEISNYNFEADVNNKSPYNSKYTEDKTVISNKENIVFNQGIDFKGDIISNGGNITVKIDSNLTGDIITNGGDITIDQEIIITGNIISNGGNITIHNHSTINGSIITTGDSKNINIKNGAKVVGNIIANGGEISVPTRMDVTGSILNPKGTLDAKNGGKLTGTAFVNKFKGDNNLFTYSEDYLNYFPFDKFNNDNLKEPSIDEIITDSSPAIEK